MNKEIMDALAESIKGFDPPSYSDLPNVGLYLEQTTKYINQVLEPLGCIQITSSMIRNYVKQGLVANPIKKVYYADHICHLMAITILKSVMSLDHIGKLFTWQQKVYTDQIAFDYFMSELETMLLYKFGQIEMPKKFSTNNTFVKTMLRSAIDAVANIIFLNVGFESMNNEKES